MNDTSFRRVYHDVLGRNSDKEALIVDTRYNGGGWLHDDLVSFLNGEDYIYFQPRGKEVGDFGAEPAFRWSRPVVVLQSESNYSDAHMFPYAFKQLNMGKLVGTPVAGTGTAVWWERLIDPTLVFGIPQVGMVTPDGDYLENTELEPDVEVYNSPESVARGEDEQLARAVEVLLEELSQ
jgi:C-terminal processing protease CtpA/Prc